MVYKSFSLNGAWEMYYQEERYTDTVNPFKGIYKEEDAAGTEPEDISNDIIENAVTTLIPNLITVIAVMAIKFVKNWRLALAALCSMPVNTVIRK